MIMNPKINVPGGANAENPAINKTATRLGLLMKFTAQLKEYWSSPVSGHKARREARA
jgi:hypothetical protein